MDHRGIRKVFPGKKRGRVKKVQEIKALFACPVDLGGITVGLISPEEMGIITQALHKDDFARFTCRPLPEEVSQEEALEQAARRLASDTCICLGLYHPQGELMGRLVLSDYNPRNQSAELGYFLLPPYRGRGVMKQVLGLLCPLFLKTPILRKLYAQTAAFNQPSLRLLRSSGFHLDGILRQHHCYGDTYADDHLFSLLTSDLPCGE